jgi:hypothetical protein
MDKSVGLLTKQEMGRKESAEVRFLRAVAVYRFVHRRRRPYTNVRELRIFCLDKGKR